MGCVPIKLTKPGGSQIWAMGHSLWLLVYVYNAMTMFAQVEPKPEYGCWPSRVCGCQTSILMLRSFYQARPTCQAMSRHQSHVHSEPTSEGFTEHWGSIYHLSKYMLNSSPAYTNFGDWLWNFVWVSVCVTHIYVINVYNLYDGIPWSNEKGGDRIFYVL